MSKYRLNVSSILKAVQLLRVKHQSLAVGHTLSVVTLHLWDAILVLCV